MKKLSFEEAEKRFVEQPRTDIYLCKDGYEGWKKNSKFFDIIENDYFWAIPKNVFIQKSSHPKRAVENRKKTNIEKYGNVCSLHGDSKEAIEVQKKVKKTNIKKYGTEYAFQNKEIQEKTKQTIKEKYGVENASQSEEIKKKKEKTSLQKWNEVHPMKNKTIQAKHKNTLTEKYSVDHISKIDFVKEKKKQTFLQKFGINNPMLQPYAIEKKDKTMLERYGTTLSWLVIPKIIIELDMPFKTWYELLPEPKPNYGWIISHFIGKTKISIAELDEVLKGHGNKKSALEIFSEKMLGVEHFDKKPIKEIKYRPDFILSDTIFLNVDGLYWHSEKNKDKWYHYNLRKEFEKSNLRIIQIREDEILKKASIVQSIINNSIKKTQNKIFARKCNIMPVLQNDANDFLAENHLMGAVNARHIGLYYNNQLVSILSYKQKGNVSKVERFCTVVNTSVVGGFSKLLNHLENNILPKTIKEIHNWVDLRYGTGSHLQNKGFYLARETLGWKWTDGCETFNRLRCRANMDQRGLSQAEHAIEFGWYKIYDAGQRLWIKKIN